MKLRATVAAAAAALSLTIAPSASAAQLDLGTLLGADAIASGVINTVDCGTLKTVLQGIDSATEGELLTETTTQSQLAKGLQGLGKVEGTTNPALALAAVKYSTQTAQRAQACGIVKADAPGSFDLSSQLETVLPFVETLSSKA